jgi:hypothetical protein
MGLPSLSAGVFSPDMIGKRAQVTLTDKNIGLLSGTLFSTNHSINNFIKTEAYEEYKYMRAGQHPREAGQRPCTITVLIYNPLSDSQSKKLNDQRAKNSNYFAVGVSAITGGVTRSKAAGLAAGVWARNYALEKLRAFDAGDILVTFETNVSGGIGQQRRYNSIVIKRSAYNPNLVSP